MPEAVQAATDTYMRESDVVARFVEDCCVEHPSARAAMSDPFAEWTRWAADEGADPGGQRAFGQALTRLGYEPAKATGGRRVRKGLGLLVKEQ